MLCKVKINRKNQHSSCLAKTTEEKRRQGGDKEEGWTLIILIGLLYKWKVVTVLLLRFLQFFFSKITISYSESSGFLVSGVMPGRLWGHQFNQLFLLAMPFLTEVEYQKKISAFSLALRYERKRYRILVEATMLRDVLQKHFRELMFVLLNFQKRMDEYVISFQSQVEQV